MTGQTVSIRQACDLCGVGRRTIYNWLAKGLLTWKRTAGGAVRIDRDSLWRSRDGQAFKAAP